MTIQSLSQTETLLQLNAKLLKPYDIECISLAYDILTNDRCQPICIEALAAQVGINRNKLHYGFKQLYGMSIHEFQTQQCMKKAQLLLSTTHKPVKNVATIIGYRNSGDFSFAFKQRFGITPLKFRKQATLGQNNIFINNVQQQHNNRK